MSIALRLAGISLIFFIVACAPAGYYDSNGVYRSYGKSDSFRHDNNMAGTPDTAGTNTVVVAPPAEEDADDVAPASAPAPYTHAGYYDRNGYYISGNSAPNVPIEYLPPRGMCRIWFPDRPASEQSTVESCTGINSRVPVGAYVMYGG